METYQMLPILTHLFSHWSISLSFLASLLQSKHHNLLCDPNLVCCTARESRVARWWSRWSRVTPSCLSSASSTICPARRVATSSQRIKKTKYSAFSVFVSIRIGPGQCCGSGSDGSVIIWPPGSGSVILKYGSESLSRSLIFIKTHWNFRKKD